MDWSRNFDLCRDAQMVSTSKYRRFWEEVGKLYLNYCCPVKVLHGKK